MTDPSNLFRLVMLNCSIYHRMLKGVQELGWHRSNTKFKHFQWIMNHHIETISLNEARLVLSSRQKYFCIASQHSLFTLQPLFKSTLISKNKYSSIDLSQGIQLQEDLQAELYASFVNLNTFINA